MWSAIERGFFRDEGLDVELKFGRGITILIQGLIANEYNIIQITPDTAMIAINGGAPWAYIAANQRASAVQMIVNDKIKNWEDLRGKRLVVGEKGSTYHLLAERMLAPNNIKSSDLSLLHVANQPDRYSTIKSGQVDAAFVAQPFDFQLLAEGYRSLGIAAESIKDDEFNGFVLARGWGEQNRDTVTRFLRAVSKGNRWLNDPANKAEATALLAKQLQVEPLVAEQTYDLLVTRLKAFSPDLSIAKPAHQFWLDAFVQSGEIAKPAPPLSKFIEESYTAALPKS
jgi:ABC-type nitrate/sulfonate/bicarbonate transport system substrate-binding protein